MSATVNPQGINIPYHGRDKEDHQDVRGETNKNNAAIRISNV